MPSARDVERVRLALSQLVASARGDLLKAFDELGTWDRIQLKRALNEAWPELIEAYGDMAAAFGADTFDEWADQLKIRRPTVVLAPGVDAERAAARARWAATTAAPMANLSGLVDELVKQPFRSTMQDSALASGAGWARVPSGSETCAFCLMLASRGGVYTTKQLAQFGTKGKKYHGDCDCQPVLVRGPEDYPAGYDPEGMYELYSLARDEAGTTEARAVTAKLREIAPNLTDAHVGTN